MAHTYNHAHDAAQRQPKMPRLTQVFRSRAITAIPCDPGDCRHDQDCSQISGASRALSYPFTHTTCRSV